MQFGSDNHTGCSPRVLEAIVQANAGWTPGYGDDDWTGRAVAALQAVFETDLDAFFVTTGTAANGLALSSAVRPWEVVLCHAQSHIAQDESTAPEFFTNGARVTGIGHGEARLTAATLQQHLDRAGHHPPHNARAAAVSVAQASECGLVYSPAEIAALARCAHERGMVLHVDGARFGNALAAQGCSPAELSWRAGVDILSLGASKSGCLAAEAVLVFRKDLSAALEQQRKRSGHLLSKGRFLGAQVIAWLGQGHWLDLARLANQRADELARELADIPGVSLVWPAQANEVFALIPRAAGEALLAQGAQFYEWNTAALPPDQRCAPQQMFVRLVCSFLTTSAEVAAFAAGLRQR